MYRDKRVSIIFPIFNEEKNTRKAIEDFYSHPAVDEIIAVDNNSTDSTSLEIKKTHARYIFEVQQGYGAALLRGLREATGDLLVSCEPDGTYAARDLEKLLVYSSEFDVVFGTRTSRAFIHPAANMRFFRRIGNRFVAKLLVYLFHGPPLTDVGCSYTLINRGAYEIIKKTLTNKESLCWVEIIIRILQYKIKYREIPMHYLPRIGESKISGRTIPAVILGIRIIVFTVTQLFFPNKFRI